ncbi:diiron oxygenase [Streptomyces sp. NPDC101062]|uniref:AurF N-oxygenase family protein n=1 Tax=unclassified Streptomyces TaxID=2593676 RepID=UPI002E75B186|nr:diiron oxygenase [Streptomyces sp. JV176]MEE1804336.1 diiron oxygenase [Streptomyces sp. JV176]
MPKNPEFGAFSVAERLRSLPEHDPNDPVENAILSRLAGNWDRRATVRRREETLDDVFERDKPDFPVALLPFRNHPTYLGLDDEAKAQLLAWGWVAFNKNVMDIEQYVVNPGFGLIAREAFDTGLDESLVIAVTQAMVDEQYHTLMHLNASAVTRRQRGWRMPDSALPLGYKTRRHAHRLSAAGTPEHQALVSLAFTTVAEVSINAHLDLIAEDHEIQPVNRLTAVLHNRDEYCHASIASTVVQEAWKRFTPEQRGYFLTELADGMEAFAAHDFTTWARIMELLGVEGGGQMLQDIKNASGSGRLLQDFSGLRSLCQELDVLDSVPFDWSTVATDVP